MLEVKQRGGKRRYPSHCAGLPADRCGGDCYLAANADPPYCRHRNKGVSHRMTEQAKYYRPRFKLATEPVPDRSPAPPREPPAVGGGGFYAVYQYSYDEPAGLAEGPLVVSGDPRELIEAADQLYVPGGVTVLSEVPARLGPIDRPDGLQVIDVYENSARAGPEGLRQWLSAALQGRPPLRAPEAVHVRRSVEKDPLTGLDFVVTTSVPARQGQFSAPAGEVVVVPPDLGPVRRRTLATPK